MGTQTRVLIVSGAPGAGKSTLASRLAAALGLPLIAKDTIKEALGNVLPVRSVEESRRLGGAAVAAMFALAAAQIDVGVGAVLDTPLLRGVSEDDVARLAARARVAIVHLRADGDTLRARYLARVASGTRHPVHLDGQRVESGDLLGARRYDPLPLPVPTLLVDTGDGWRPGVDEIVAWARS